jgi:hypothetical protein
MLANASPCLIEQLEAADEALTTKTIFTDLEPLVIDRLTFPLCGDPEPVGMDTVNKRVAIIFDELKKGEKYSPKVVSLLAERILELLLLRAHRPESMEGAYLIGERVLQMLKEDHQAIRRLR